MADQEKDSTVQDTPENLEPEITDENKSDVDPKITELEDKVSDLEDKYIRAQAEIVNMQRRNEKEQATIIKYDGQGLAKAILPVLDNLERALQIEIDDENGQQLKKGIEMVHQHLKTALKENNVDEIKTDSEFDPTIHQAVQTVAADDEHPSDSIVQVLQKGYILKDRVLRPAMVVVAQ